MSVYGTGDTKAHSATFLGNLDLFIAPAVAGTRRRTTAKMRRICLPQHRNACKGNQCPSSGSSFRFTLLITLWHRYWNIYQLCIGYSLRPYLSSRLTLRGRALPRKPWDFGDLEFNQIYRYLCLHSHFLALHGRFRFHFAARGTLSYHWPCGQSIASVHDFSPDHFRRNFTRWVSCYALFKWWLPLSQHPGCLRNPTSLVT